MLFLGCTHVPAEAPKAEPKGVVGDEALLSAADGVLFLHSTWVSSTGELQGSASGSAVAMGSSEGFEYFITARHCVDGAEIIMLTGKGSSFRVINRVMGKTPDDDWAILMCKEGSSPKWPTPAIDLGDLKLYEPCVAIGYPLGIETPTVTYGNIQGSISEKRRRISAPIIFGNSGGAVFVKRGSGLSLVGLVIAGYAQRNGSLVPHMGIMYSMAAIAKEIH
jgi:S1-C subfamily serine protease